MAHPGSIQGQVGRGCELIWWKVSLPMSGEWNQMIFKVSLSPDLSVMILCSWGVVTPPVHVPAAVVASLIPGTPLPSFYLAHSTLCSHSLPVLAILHFHNKQVPTAWLLPTAALLILLHPHQQTVQQDPGREGSPSPS